MLKNKSNFPNKNVGSALKEMDEKVKKNPKIPPVDVIDGRFEV